MHKGRYLERCMGATWFPYTSEEEVLIVGAGGLGSFAALAISRLGCDIIIYDQDDYTSVNLTGQLAKLEDIGINKAVAIRQTLHGFTPDCKINAIAEMYTEDSMTCPITITCPDNNATRKLVFEKWMHENWENKYAIFIDARAGMDLIEIFCVTKDKAEDYRKTLLDDSQYEEGMCTTKQTTYTTQIAGGMIANYFKNYIMQVEESTIFNVPFYTSYNLSTMEINHDLGY